MTLSVADAETQLDKAIVFHASLVAQYRAKFQTMETALIQGNDGDFGADSLIAMQAYRNQLNALMSKSSVQAILLPKLRELSKSIGAPAGTNIQQMFFFLKKYYWDTPRTIKSRDITFDVSFSVSGTGNGQLVRLVKDRKSKQIEGGFGFAVENKTCECVQDQMTLGPSGRHNEKFRMAGQPAVAGDFISLIGGVVSGDSTVKEFDTTGPDSKVLKNGNLTSNNSAGSVTTMFTNWTLDSLTGSAVDTTNVHIANFGQTAASWKVSAAGRSLTQRLPSLNSGIPYLPFLAYNRQAGSAPAGTQITIAWGSKSQTLTLAGTETGWNYFIVDRDEDLWTDNFYEDQVDFVVSVPTLASGFINISMIHLFPMINIGGTWWAILPGSTPFKKLDNFGTIADSFVSSDSLIQRYLAYAFDEYLNHSGTPDHADPALP